MTLISNAALAADYFLGCDVSKHKLDAALINAQGAELWASTILNDGVAIATFLLTLTGAYPDKAVQCVVEATGIYHQLFAETSYGLGIPCRVYNPIITKSGIKGSVRGKKTDRTDATIIARMGLRGEGRLYSPEPYMTTKHYARSCQKLSILNSSFRQYKNHIAGLLGGELTDDATALLDGIQIAIKEARAQLYKDLAESAKGATFARLQTIPGIGPYIAASLIGEIQSMERFKDAHALVAYAGLDPRIKQSGHTLNNTGRLTKRGSSYLRRNIFIAAGVARQFDPQFRALYDKKRAEGKPYTVATCVVARKLLSIVRAVWLSEQNYDVSQWPERKVVDSGI
jgi:transposase